jgi:hypothetical protein
MGKLTTALFLLTLAASSCGGPGFDSGAMETTTADAGTLDNMNTEPSPSAEASSIDPPSSEAGTMPDAGSQTAPDASTSTSTPDVGAELVDAGAPAWSGNEDVYYHLGDVVSYGGSLWKCTQEHASRPDWYPGAPSLPVLWVKL